ncbi:MAG: dephospho-CoA kinase [Oscillospiraceae bacterium]|nr:dephospho-CoA kinase [Oscillospiraceae bacterium]
MKLIGLTGPSGAGKSTALAFLAERGVYTIDADRVYHELLETGAALRASIAELFPDTLSGGKIDRKALARAVFANRDALAALERVTHPAVLARVDEMLERYGRCEASDGGREKTAAVEAIALIESGMAAKCDIVVAVIAGGADTARIEARDGLCPREAAERRAAQKDDAFYIRGADIVIRNDGGLRSFENEVAMILNKIGRTDAT